jgi:Amt family ammonium transporter
MLPLAGGEDRPRFELLLRLRSPGDEPVGPAKFLAIAERHGLMTRIDRWVVGEALRCLKAHAGALAGGSVRFSINLSAAAVGDESFHDFLEAAVRESAVPPGILCFEISESATVANLPRADRLMQRLRLQGCGFALDDFGAGLSSLGQLKTLPISVLKIDGSLVREASTNQRVEAMVRAIAQLAHTMGMETVAEFVETDASRTRMASLGIDYGQGYAIGRPTPLDDVLADFALYSAVAGWS